MPEQAYQSFNSQLLAEEFASENIVLDSQKSYSTVFIAVGEMRLIRLWQTLVVFYGTDVLIVTGNSFMETC